MTTASPGALAMDRDDPRDHRDSAMKVLGPAVDAGIGIRRAAALPRVEAQPFGTERAYASAFFAGLEGVIGTKPIWKPNARPIF